MGCKQEYSLIGKDSKRVPWPGQVGNFREFVTTGLSYWRLKLPLGVDNRSKDEKD